MDADVLIVGAGPTGLMLANQLARRGIRILIIDRHAGPSLQTRALGVQARTLEIYAQLGLVDRALELGKRGTGANLWAQGKRTARVPLGDMGESATPYPFILILGQDDNERILGDKLRTLNIDVQWRTELIGLKQQVNGVTVTLKRFDGTSENRQVAWVAGCDGAHSFVRQACNITFPGAPYEHVFFVADTEATGRMVPDEVNVYLWRQGFHLLFPMRGADRWRIVGILPPHLRSKEATFDDVIPSLRNEAGADLSFKHCFWFSTYRIHHRSAVRFRDRRCFLLGDAAHIHSPVGAQGMNTGLQDAYNLGWKLALVIKAQAAEALLKSYEAERRPVAARLLNTTDRAFRVIVADNWFAGLLRSQILARIAAFALRFKRLQSAVFRIVSQIGIRYRNSSLSKTQDDLPKTAPHAGDRFPWVRLKFSAHGPVEDLFDKFDDLHFHLLVIGQPAPAEDALKFGGLLHLHVLTPDAVNAAALARAHIPPTCFYLLRPDGHIGLCGARLNLQAIHHYRSVIALTG